eukprot:g6074.t1
MLDSPCARRVLNGAVFGGAMGASIGALYGTFEAFRYKVPGIYKIRHIGQTTLSATAVSGISAHDLSVNLWNVM